MFLQFLFLQFFLCTSHSIRPGPSVGATKGEVWPKPQHQEKFLQYYIIQPDRFTFKAPENIACPNFINDAFTRYWKLIGSSYSSTLDDNSLGYLETLNIVLQDKCSSENILPTLDDREDYNITINELGAQLSATTIWGVLHGLETFSQLIYKENDVLIINATTIVDYPRFPHRGLLIDTARHFEPVDIILQMLDAMAYNKFNVFHWHIVDDQSFPYKSRTFPELSDLGAYHPIETVYQQSDISRIIEYARLRGIRVIPEFDTPGHTRSWGVSHPEILTECFSGSQPNGELGPLNPIKNETYEFMGDLLEEIVGVFPDGYFHVGGDEVDFDCWESNPDITTFMSDNSIASYEDLESYYIQQILTQLDNLDTKYLVWEEVFSNGVNLPNSTVVHVWKTNGLSTLLKVIESGHYGLYSSCWYLSVLHDGGDWESFYKCEPLVLIHGEEQRRLVLGGEACMWGEYVNEYSIIPRVWPRASAVAERLWSAEDVTDVDDAQRRLEEHACRMNKRGIAAQPPNNAGVCLE